MKIFDINGKLQNIDVRPSSYPLKSRSKSILQDKVKEYLISKYPRSGILEEFIIPGSRLSVDFFLPKEGLVFEIQGIQHSEHNPFFHGDKRENKYASQKRRDMKKVEWAETNGFKLIEIFEEKDLKTNEQ